MSLQFNINEKYMEHHNNIIDRKWNYAVISYYFK